MLKKHIIAASAAAMLSATPTAFANDLSSWTIDGFALFEFWLDSDQGADGYTDLASFTLHNITFSSARKVEGGNRFIWAVGQRLRNGNLGEEGFLGNREAWAGFEGDSWGAIKFGRFLTKTWQVLDWPYAAPSAQAETFAEIGAQGYWVVTRAVRYSSPIWGPVNFEVTYDTGNQNDTTTASNQEIYVHVETRPVKVDFTWNTVKNSDLAMGAGIYGATDTTPNIVDGTEHGVMFLGGRFAVPGGVTMILGAKQNRWENDAGIGGFFWSSPALPDAGTTEVTQMQYLVGANIAFGKNLVGIGAILFEAAEDADGTSLEDEATSIGFKWEREIGTNARAYFFARHLKLDGENRPYVAFPWQFGNLESWGADQQSMTRIGVGGQMMY
jgi:predicted porin